MNKISEAKLIDEKDDIETYEALMKINFQEIKTEKECFFYKQKLKDSGKDLKIYDIVKDNINNIVCISYDQNINIDKILNEDNEETKESIVKGRCKPISKKEIDNLFKKEDSMCKIKFYKKSNGKLEESFGTGFFCKLKDDVIPFNYCLITNNHVLDEEHIQINKKIEFELKNENKRIEITKNRRTFTDKTLDYTCIEILQEDNINEFFEIDDNVIHDDINILKEKEIFILQFPEGKELSFSEGIIIGIKEGKIIHNSSTKGGSSGSPIILRSFNLPIIGLHYGAKEDICNLAIPFNLIIEDIKKKINQN